MYNNIRFENGRNHHLMSEIAFLSIGRVEPNPEWHTVPGAHEFHELVLVHTGGMSVEGGDGRIHHMGAGDCALYPAGALHREYSDRESPAATSFICFHGDLPEKEIAVHPDLSGRLPTLAQWLWEWQLTSESGGVWADSCLRFLLAVWRENGSAPPEDPRLRRLRQFLVGHLNRPLRLAELAEAAGMSSSHLLHYFRAHLGTSPMEYCRTLRCREAARLLIYTNLPLKEIADQTGFADPYHFSKRFKAFSGLSPSQYRDRASRR